MLRAAFVPFSLQQKITSPLQAQKSCTKELSHEKSARKKFVKLTPERLKDLKGQYSHP